MGKMALTIDNVISEASGNFRCGKYSLIPYRHHKNKMQWKVVVIMHAEHQDEESPEEDDTRGGTGVVTVIADTTRIAAFAAISAFHRGREDKELCKEIGKEMKKAMRLENEHGCKKL